MVEDNIFIGFASVIRGLFREQSLLQSIAATKRFGGNSDFLLSDSSSLSATQNDIEKYRLPLTVILNDSEESF